MNVSPVLFTLIVLSAVLGFEAIVTLLRARGAGDPVHARRRLRSLASSLQAEGGGDETSLLRTDRDRESTLDRVLAGLPFATYFTLCLYRAGLTLSLRRFFTISVALAGAGALCTGAFLPFPGAPLFGLVAGALPYLHVRRLGRKRTLAFEQQFPDALDLLIRALRAGHAFSVGLQMVGEELPDPVGREFALVADEIQLGKDVRSSLANLAYRVDAPDLPFFVVAVTMQQETGSNLAEVLGNLSGVIRERFKLYGKVRGLTAMGRASANLLAGWPAVMVGSLYAVNPDYITPLWTTKEGHLMMLIAALMILVGYVVCRRMATIEV
jgi:tight adherence protein B